MSASPAVILSSRFTSPHIDSGNVVVVVSSDTVVVVVSPASVVVVGSVVVVVSATVVVVVSGSVVVVGTQPSSVEGSPVHVAPVHSSETVQESPSLHALPSGSGPVQLSALSSHDSAQLASPSGPWHGSPE
jgi:hypothetical protein